VRTRGIETYLETDKSANSQRGRNYESVQSKYDNEDCSHTEDTADTADNSSAQASRRQRLEEPNASTAQEAKHRRDDERSIECGLTIRHPPSN
jgi:hypothetical protein